MDASSLRPLREKPQVTHGMEIYLLDVECQKEEIICLWRKSLWECVPHQAYPSAVARDTRAIPLTARLVYRNRHGIMVFRANPAGS